MSTITSNIPDGYILGLGRDVPYPKIAHLYQGSYGNVGDPMCQRGYNRGPDSFSIWRGNMGEYGVCDHCLRRARAGKPGVKPKGPTCTA